MKKAYYLNTAIWMITGALLLSACSFKRGSGNIVSENRNVSAFESIKVSEGIEAEVSNGPLSVRVEADDNLIRYIQTEVRNSRLKVNLDLTSVDDAHMKVYITAPDIRKIAASSGATVDIINVLKHNERIELDASSAAAISGGVDAPEVALEASSGAELDVEGRTRNLKAKASSGSTIDAAALKSETAEVRSSSGSTAKVYASVQLKAQASSGSSVHHSGGAQTEIKQSSGGVVRAD
ncbi:MAG: DUF2807 domain-containing protein [Ferruginibacter sp.]|nr:DUF2807 domain-containing protein [Ferruginibacter sp.]